MSVTGFYGVVICHATLLGCIGWGDGAVGMEDGVGILEN